MTDQQEIRITEEEAKQAIALAEALEKLEKNRAFKSLILDDYFTKEPVRMVGMIGSPNDAAAKGSTNVMIGIGALQAYFNKVYRQAQQAEYALEQLKEVEQEELEGLESGQE